MNVEMFDWVCIGETMAQFVPVGGRVESATQFDFRVAGSESNVAFALAGLGVSAAWASRVGEDALGHRIVDYLSAAGVDTSLVEFDPQRRTGLFLKVPSGGRRQVVYYREGSAATQIDRSLVHRAIDANPRGLFISGITCAISPEAHDAVTYAFALARGRAIPVAFDVNYRAALWPSRARAASTLLEVANRADVVFVGDEESSELWGTDGPGQLRRILPRPELVLRRPPTEVIAFDADTVTSVRLPPVDVVESVGAGDAFAAGYLYGHQQGWATQARLRAGHLLAVSALSRLGDEASMTVSELHQGLGMFEEAGSP